MATDLLNTVIVGGSETAIMVATVITLRLSLRKDKKVDKKKQDENDLAMMKMALERDAVIKSLVDGQKALKDKLDKETGDNNNGFRQKLNEHAASVSVNFAEIRATQLKIQEKADKLDEKTDKLSDGLSELRGAFNERTRVREKAQA